MSDLTAYSSDLVLVHWLQIWCIWHPCSETHFVCNNTVCIRCNVYYYLFLCSVKARERDATGGEKRLGLEMADTLKKIIDPYFLRRTKAEVKEDEKNAGTKGKPHQKSVK